MNTQVIPTVNAAITSDSVLAHFSKNGIEVIHTDGREMAAENHEGLERYAFIRGGLVLSVLIILDGWLLIREDKPVLSVARSENGGRDYVEVGRDLTERQAAYIVLRHFGLLRNGDE